MKRFPTKREFECGASFDYGRGETWLSMFQINPHPRVYRVGGRSPSGEFISRTFTTIAESRKFMRSVFRAHH